MLEECQEKYNIDLSESWFVGDTTMDIRTGVNAGIKTVLVLTGEAGKDGKYHDTADIICSDLMDAVNKIMEK
jgi:phosphoglycolate phosphatase-like HAD superfamily hydrolase